MERLNVRVDDSLKRKLEAEAEARDQGVSPSEIVRQAPREHLGRRAPEETCLDIALRIGLLGAYKDAPTDLSTNPDHMEGFGE